MADEEYDMHGEHTEIMDDDFEMEERCVQLLRQSRLGVGSSVIVRPYILTPLALAAGRPGWAARRARRRTAAATRRR